MVTSPKELGPKKDSAGEERTTYTKDGPVFSTERVPHINKTVTVKQ
jgi:hypothetical protein